MNQNRKWRLKSIDHSLCGLVLLCCYNTQNCCFRLVAHQDDSLKKNHRDLYVSSLKNTADFLSSLSLSLTHTHIHFLSHALYYYTYYFSVSVSVSLSHTHFILSFLSVTSHTHTHTSLTHSHTLSFRDSFPSSFLNTLLLSVFLFLCLCLSLSLSTHTHTHTHTLILSLTLSLSAMTLKVYNLHAKVSRNNVVYIKFFLKKCGT